LVILRLVFVCKPQVDGKDPAFLFPLLMLPTLRLSADFSLWETYRCMRSEPLTCPIVAFGGLQDSRVSCEQLESWREETRGQFSLHLFPGSHFFLHAQTMPLLAMIARYLEPQVHRMALHMPLSAVRYRQNGAQDCDLF
jgi:surfactin synthase thioesterase subunit